MKNKHILLFLVIGLVAAMLAACSRSASKGIATVTPKKTSFPGLKTLQTQQNMGGTVEAIATQTARSHQIVITIDAATPTPIPPAATATPAANIANTATLAPMVVPPLVVPANYELKTDEFPYCIARRFNVNPEELMSLNGLSGSSFYYAGKVLKIPQTGGTFPGQRALKSHPATYTVKTDDTIYGIACYYGDVDPMAIAAVNGLTAPYKLTTGQTLQIP